MSAIDVVKKHPVAIGGAVIVVFIVVLLISGSGSSGNASTSSQDSSASLALAQLSAQMQANSDATQAAKEIQLGGQQTQLAIAQLDFQEKSAEVAANLQLGLKAQDTQQQTNTLQEALGAAQIKANVDMFTANQATLASQIAANKDVSLAAIEGQTKIATQPKNCGLLGFVFGC